MPLTVKGTGMTGSIVFDRLSVEGQPIADFLKSHRKTEQKTFYESRTTLGRQRPADKKSEQKTRYDPNTAFGRQRREDKKAGQKARNKAFYDPNTALGRQHRSGWKPKTKAHFDPTTTQGNVNVHPSDTS
jgi:hypothetical protein